MTAITVLRRRKDVTEMDVDVGYCYPQHGDNARTVCARAGENICTRENHARQSSVNYAAGVVPESKNRI